MDSLYVGWGGANSGRDVDASPVDFAKSICFVRILFNDYSMQLDKV